MQTISFLSLPFWPGSGQGKNMRIRADPDPKPCENHILFYLLITPPFKNYDQVHISGVGEGSQVFKMHPN